MVKTDTLPMPITVYLKNMAGEIQPMEVDHSWSEADLLASLARLSLCPLGRVQILRASGPLEDQEILPIWVEDGPYVERWEDERGLRYVVPHAEGTIYIRRIVLHYTWVRFAAERMGASGPSGPSYSSGPSDPSYSSGPSGPSEIRPYLTLYDALLAVWPEVTPSDMRRIYSVVLPDLEKESVRKGLIYHYEYSQEEPVECECGCVVRRVDLSRHEKSVEHLERI